MSTACRTILLLYFGATFGAAAYNYRGSSYASSHSTPSVPAGSPYQSGSGSSSSPTDLDCHIAILGAGFSGAYAAYQLAPQFKDGVCVVEKLTRYGGRIHDIPERDDREGPVYGIGPLGLESNHINMLSLAKELGIEVQADDDNGVTLQQVRGNYFLSTDKMSNSQEMCAKVFPTLNCTGWNNTDTDKGMWRYILDIFDTQPDIVNEYADFTLFLRAMVGTEGFEFLRASTIWQSNFQAGVSAETMLDWFNHVDNPDRTSFQRPYRYLKGGMSQYPFRLIDKAIAHGTRVSTSEAVLSIESTPDVRFLITTTKRTITADRIINAIDPYAFRNITGNVARDIQNTEEFKSIKATTCATVDAWWDERFWERSKIRKNHTLLQISNHAECFNLMEIPNYAYVKGSNVTRAVYDDGVCIDTWRAILDSGNNSLLMEEIKAGMQRVFTDIVVPLPRTVKGVVHEQAWHNLGALSKFTNDDIRKWAIRPAETWDVSMVGEAYNPAFSAWTEGAVRSTMWTLQERHGFSFPCLESLSLKAVDCAKL